MNYYDAFICTLETNRYVWDCQAKKRVAIIKQYYAAINRLSQRT